MNPFRRRRETRARRRPWLLVPLGAFASAFAAWRLVARRRSPRVAEAMTHDPVAVAEDTTVQDAARLMREHDVGSLPVVHGGRVVGMVTDRDIAVRVAAEAADPAGVPVREIASREIVAARPEQRLDEALELMAQHRVRRLPVVANGDRLVGIVAQADVAREAPEQEAGEVVEQISEPTEASRS